MKKVIIVTVIALVSQLSLSADDTEVFFAPTTTINPNVLFIMDNSTSMGLEKNKINGKHRIDIMKDALAAVLVSKDVDNINVGISNYGNSDEYEAWRNDHANGIQFPVLPLNSLVKPVIESSLTDKAGKIQWRHHRQPAPEGNGEATYYNPIVDNFNTLTVRQYLVEVAKMWAAKGNTPIVDALYEAALYFRGGAIHWKDTSGYGGRANYIAAAHPAAYHWPANTFHPSKEFPGAEYPFIPEWYADHLSSSWEERSVEDLGPKHPEDGYWSYFRYKKSADDRWLGSYIDCPSNTGYPEYKPIKDSGPSTQYNCRVMRNDFVKFLNEKINSSLFNEVAESVALDEADHTREYWRTDSLVDKAIRSVSDTVLGSLSSKKQQFGEDHLISYHFSEFPRCRVIKERRCGFEGNSYGLDYLERRSKYKCVSDNPEDCKEWDFEQCQDPNDEFIVNVVNCDFDQNTSRYPDANYISPIVGDCQSNYIVLMSDGKPEYSKSYDKNSLVEDTNVKSELLTSIKSLMGITACDTDPYFSAGTCGPQLTEYLATHDNMPDESIAKGDQFIKTMVIGFSSTVTGDAKTTNYLKSLVTVEDDPQTPEREGFFLATDEVGLVKAFTDALNGIVATTRSQASPGYSVNIKNGLEHENAIYIPVFDKKKFSSWSGNLKKFKLVSVAGSRHIRGKKDVAGTVSSKDAMTDLGLFQDDAWDFWSNSTSADGSSVEEGGVASLLTDPATRALYSDISPDKNLWDSKNAIRASNTNLSNAMLGASSNEEKTVLINYIRGWENGVSGNAGVARKHMGDMLHSGPIIINFPDINNVKQQFIFAATNEGYLHAFDTTSGVEKFAFMPQQLLKNIKRQRTGNVSSDDEHIYGIDGSLSYIKDGSDVYLYFGLRRGGKAYYALKITQGNNGQLYPKLLWKIDGETDTNFSHLGQSWSAPYIANVMHNGTKKTVVVFTGGNDTAFDYGRGSTYTPTSVTQAKQASTANDIYIVNAKTGKRLWSMRETMGNTDVKHAIPSGARLIDTNKNGLLDRLYFSDTGGNVWRLDLHENLSDPSKSKLTKLASLATKEDGTYEGRKFYTEPDVGLVTDNGHMIYTISLGSGLRPHPLNKEIKDHMFVLLDKSPFYPLASNFKTIYMDDLSKVSIGKTGTGKSIVKDSNFEGKKITQVVGKHGWYVDFNDDGEKVLSSSITFEGSVIFTTLAPNVDISALENSCETPATQGRVYALDILTGEASMNLDRDSDTQPDDDDAFEIISPNEIPGTPQRIFNNLQCSNGSCKHIVDIRIGKKSTEVGGKDVAELEPVYWYKPD